MQRIAGVSLLALIVRRVDDAGVLHAYRDCELILCGRSRYANTTGFDCEGPIPDFQRWIGINFDGCWLNVLAFIEFPLYVASRIDERCLHVSGESVVKARDGVRTGDGDFPVDDDLSGIGSNIELGSVGVRFEFNAVKDMTQHHAFDGD